VVSKVQRKLVLDEERGKKKQSMTYGLNGQHVFCATHVYVLSIENGMNCFVPSPSDWTPGFFWKVNVFFAGSLLSEEFVLCESLDIGSTTLYITRVPISSDLDTKDSERFCNDDIVNIEIVEHRQHSMAMLQKYCIRFRNNPEDACMAKHIEQLGEKTPAGNTTEKVEKQGGKKENEINLRVQSTAIAARMKATSSEVATRIVRVAACAALCIWEHKATPSTSLIETSPTPREAQSLGTNSSPSPRASKGLAYTRLVIPQYVVVHRAPSTYVRRSTRRPISSYWQAAWPYRMP
jgi:hypothetical protein